MQVWIDFNGEQMQLKVTVSPLQMPMPSWPLLTCTIDLASLMLDSMHVGFCSSDCPFHTRHYFLGWSFKMNGVAKLPSFPVIKPKGNLDSLVIGLRISSCLIVILVVVATVVRILSCFQKEMTVQKNPIELEKMMV